MKKSTHIKTILLFLISFLLDTQNTSAKTKLNVGQNGIVKQANIEIYKNAQGVLNNALSQQYVGQGLDMLFNVKSLDNAHWTVNFAKNKGRTFEIVINNTLHTKTADNIENFNEIVKLLWQKAFTEYAQDMFTNLGKNKINQLFRMNEEILDPNHFKTLLNDPNDQTFLNNALKFIKVE